MTRKDKAALINDTFTKLHRALEPRTSSYLGQYANPLDVLAELEYKEEKAHRSQVGGSFGVPLKTAARYFACNWLLSCVYNPKDNPNHCITLLLDIRLSCAFAAALAIRCNDEIRKGVSKAEARMFFDTLDNQYPFTKKV